MPKYILDSAAKTVIDLDSKSYIYFGGTNYLGLGYHPEIVMAAQEGLIRWGISSAGSRETAGSARVHLELERILSDFLECEDVSISCSGYLSDLIIMQTLSEEFDICLMDEFTHISVVDAIASTDRKSEKFKHRDPNDLEVKLIKLNKQGKRVLISSDAVFASTGLLCPLDIYNTLANRWGASILVNDAHGFGILGKNSRGIIEYYDLNYEHIFLNGSMSKALGCFGGFSAGKSPLTEKIRTRSSAYLGSTPLSPAIAHAAIVALQIIKKGEENLFERLRNNTKTMKNGLKRLGFEIEDSPVPRVAFSLGDEKRDSEIHRKLLKEQILIPYTSYPGGEVETCFRMVVTAQHTERQISQALEVLESAMNRM